MESAQAHIILTIETRRAIELGDFVGVFTGVASQYDRFIRENHPDLSPDARIYVQEIRKGSIVADLVTSIAATAPLVLHAMDQVLVVDQFVERFRARLSKYFQPGGKDESASKSDLRDFMDSVQAIANDPDAHAAVESAVFEDGKKQVRAALTFDTQQARQARQQIEEHSRLLERTSGADRERVLMIFTQSNIKSPEVGKRTGERVVIDSISARELPLIYASNLAEQRIKHEITEADENVFKRGFVVDANVELREGKPVAYRVTQVHQVIDLPDEE